MIKNLGIHDAHYRNGDKVSQWSMNIESGETIDFTTALVQKYVTYFAKTGSSEIFNFGADVF